MIAIDNILVSDECVNEKFVCDLDKCKGGCCVDGDAGAPLAENELEELNQIFEKVLPYLTEEGIREIKKSGRYLYNKEFGWVTPTIEKRICAYGITDEKGIVKCGIEQAFLDNKIKWRKPISCHLYPIRIKKSSNKKDEYVNYEPREDLCKHACTLGKKLKIPVYIFLKDALIRKYGTAFYDALEKTAKHLGK